MDTRNRTNMKFKNQQSALAKEVKKDEARRLAWSAYRQATFWPYTPEGEQLKQKLIKAVTILTEQQKHD